MGGEPDGDKKHLPGSAATIQNAISIVHARKPLAILLAHCLRNVTLAEPAAVRAIDCSLSGWQ